jgi:hypothetical protein
MGACAWAAGVGATVQLTDADAIVPLAPGGTFEAQVDGGLRGPLNVTFVGTGGYFVEWIA